MQRCTQGNQTITEYVAQFRQLISIQEAAGCTDSEATYVERLISNLHSALVPEARKFLAVFVLKGMSGNTISMYEKRGHNRPDQTRTKRHVVFYCFFFKKKEI